MYASVFEAASYLMEGGISLSCFDDIAGMRLHLMRVILGDRELAAAVLNSRYKNVRLREARLFRGRMP